MSLNQNSVRALKETQSTTSSMKIWPHPFFSFIARLLMGGAVLPLCHLYLFIYCLYGYRINMHDRS